MHETIKVLNVITNGSGDFGGIERYLLNAYSYIDRSRFKFDFAFCGKNTMHLVEKRDIFCESHFFELDVLDANKPKKVKDFYILTQKLKTIITENSYDILHVHAGSFVVQICSVFADLNSRIPVHIAHSHSLDIPPKNKKKVKYHAIKKILMRIIAKHNRLLCACSLPAGISLYGTEGVKSSKFVILNNGTDIDSFEYDEQVRLKIREEANIDDAYTVFGLVGRLSEVKNFSFAVDVFACYHKHNPKSFLWIVGEGSEKEHIVNKLKQYGLIDSAKFWGYRNDVNSIMQAMDIMLLTSFSEGMPLTAIEAQASGLPVMCSSGVPDHCKVSDLVEFYDLDLGAEKWAEYANKMLCRNKSRYSRRANLTQNGFEIKTEVKKLEDIYDRVLHGS